MKYQLNGKFNSLLIGLALASLLLWTQADAEESWSAQDTSLMTGEGSEKPQREKKR